MMLQLFEFSDMHCYKQLIERHIILKPCGAPVLIVLVEDFSRIFFTYNFLFVRKSNTSSCSLTGTLYILRVNEYVGLHGIKSRGIVSKQTSCIIGPSV